MKLLIAAAAVVLAVLVMDGIALFSPPASQLCGVASLSTSCGSVRR